MTGRAHWENCLTHFDDNVERFIAEYFSLADRKCLLIAGAGFDPRARLVSARLAAVMDERLCGLFVREERGDPAVNLRMLVDENEKHLRCVVKHSRVDTIRIFSPDDNAAVGGQRMISLFHALSSDVWRGRGHPRFAIRPYPKEWERHFALRDGTRVFVRPIRPEDERLYGPFFVHVTPEDLRLRFFAPVKDFGHAYVARFTQIDYARAMAFIAIDSAGGNMAGVVRLHADANYETGEFAILVRSDLKGRGLGWLLMQQIIDYARSEGIKTIEGQILRENSTMLAMCRELGFAIGPDPDDTDICVARLSLG